MYICRAQDNDTCTKKKHTYIYPTTYVCIESSLEHPKQRPSVSSRNTHEDDEPMLALAPAGLSCSESDCRRAPPNTCQKDAENGSRMRASVHTVLTLGCEGKSKTVQYTPDNMYVCTVYLISFVGTSPVCTTSEQFCMETCNYNS